MADPLEKAVLDGSWFAGPNPDGEEPRRPRSHSNASSHDGRSSDDDRLAFTHPSDLAGASTSTSASANMGRTSSHNTGVKGVLADYREQQQALNGQTNAINGRMQRMTVVANGNGGNSDNDDDFLSDSESAARDAYRRQRMQELLKSGSADRAKAFNSSRPRFGHLREIGQSGFVKAVEEESGIVVVVHVYDLSIASCVALNAQLSSLARRYPYTKFIRTLAVDLEFATGDEDDVLPTLLVYRGGESVKTLIAVDRELNADAGLDEDDEIDASRITQSAVEMLLVKHGVLDRSAAAALQSDSDNDSS